MEKKSKPALFCVEAAGSTYVLLELLHIDSRTTHWLINIFHCWALIRKGGGINSKTETMKEN